MKTLLSGIKCTGSPHIGNYIGMVKNALEASKGNRSFYFLADMHALTVDWDPETLRKEAREVLVMYLASGFDMENTFFFPQSQNPDHAYLGWILNCVTPMGWANGMIEYKEKAKDKEESVSVGLFDYPVLMAADILLYNPDFVPVGEDQKQHVELTRDIAKKFNNSLGETFKIPEIRLSELGKRVKSLQHPEKKMSKSDRDTAGCIYMLDEPDSVIKKIKRAVTDSEGYVGYDPEKRPGISNLVEIYSVISEKTIESILKEYEGKGYGDFKKDLAEVLHTFLVEFQKEYKRVDNDQGYIDEVLKKGLEEAMKVSNVTIEEVKKRVGFL